MRKVPNISLYEMDERVAENPYFPNWITADLVIMHIVDNELGIGVYVDRNPRNPTKIDVDIVNPKVVKISDTKWIMEYLMRVPPEDRDKFFEIVMMWKAVMFHLMDIQKYLERWLNEAISETSLEMMKEEIKIRMELREYMFGKNDKEFLLELLGVKRC